MLFKKGKNDGCCSHLGCAAPWFPRLGFGLFLAAFGVQHYMYFTGDNGFHAMAVMPFTLESASALAPIAGFIGAIAGILAIIVPGLQIVGGLLFAVKQLCTVSKFCILASLGGILGWAALIIMLNPAQMGSAVEAGTNVMLFLVAYHVIKKMSCCGACGCMLDPKKK